MFGLPLSRCFFGSPTHDLSVRHHGRVASSPLGPAAGPHTQMAQNIVLAWLAGARVFELKTVQVNDRLTIPRPCIDARTVGYNVEWSQELRIERSLREYAKASMLIEMLRHELPIEPGFGDAVYDMSVGYDLAGVRSDGVAAFIRSMMDAGPIVEELRTRIPYEYRHLRDLPYNKAISGTLTLSTFHGCPPDEIEAIIDHLMREHGLSCTIKLNPTLLGRDELEHVLHDELGYTDVRVPQSAFAKDTTWDQAVGFVERLRATAASLGLGLGVKLTNTLIVEHDGDFLPASEPVKYLSGRPLHVLAMRLVRRFRERFGPELPISFSAGIDRANFAGAVALGLTPITTCTDLLREGGYARLGKYYADLLTRMDEAGASSIAAYIRRVSGDAADPVVENTNVYVAALADDERYASQANRRPPKKVGTSLELFDCLTCDKCVPVCPNDANFTLSIPPMEVPIVTLSQRGGSWSGTDHGTLRLNKPHQIANFADFCNECGNCDVFCPEDGGPYVVKPRFFASLDGWRDAAPLDGFYVERLGTPSTFRVYGRFNGNEYVLQSGGTEMEYRGEGYSIRFLRDDPVGTVGGEAGIEVDLTYCWMMDLLGSAVLSSVNYVSA